MTDLINKNLPRDVFMYLLSIVALAFFAIAFGNLVFDLINVYLPDALNKIPLSVSYESIRWSIAVIIIAFPVYMWVMRFLNKDVSVNPEKKDLKIRKWLLYFALFVSSVVIMGDLIAIIYNFLRGELTLNFFLKMLAMAIIAGSIAYYYREIISKDTHNKFFRVFPYIISVLILIGVVFGFVAAGFPQDARAARFDQQRVNDLMNIQGQVIEYWRTHSKLPEKLSDVENIYVSVNDPKTQTPYEYYKLTDKSFDLCAVFETSNKDQAVDSINYQKNIRSISPVEQQWLHDKGKVCFEKVIDPLNYPPAVNK